MIKGTVKMISPEFVAALLDGTKQVTIRPQRARPHKINDVLDWRVWTGTAYRSPTRHVAYAVVTDYASITLHREGFEMDGIFTPRPSDLQKLAGEDGFADWPALVSWFAQRYPLPFYAYATRFRLLPVGG